MNRILHILPCFIVINIIFMMICSCTQEVYEKGEGEYSLMRGDFAEAYVDQKLQVVSIITDDGEQLALTKPYSAKWLARPDTLYRCMLYYNKIEAKNGKPASAEVISLGQVPCPVVTPLSLFDQELRTDPVKLESAWMSKSGKYINLYLQLKTGVTDDSSAVQQLAVVADTLMINPDKTFTCFLRLHHNQGNVPEYYSTKAYLSIPAYSLIIDTVRISINTYNGLVVKAFPLRK